MFNNEKPGTLAGLSELVSEQYPPLVG
jgi:hypothetical protein